MRVNNLLLLTSSIPTVFAAVHQLIVGTFGTNYLYTLEFDDEASTLDLISTTNTSYASSWISLSHDKKNLYGTAWNAAAPSFVSYAVENGTSLQASKILPLGGNCTGNSTKAIFTLAESKAPYAVYGTPFGGTAGCGSVMSVDDDGVLDQVIQNFTYASDSGVHGVALNSDNTFLYSADDSGNSLWTHKVDATSGTVEVVDKLAGPVNGSDPRHVVVHPEGKYLYVVLEGANQVAVYSINNATGIPSFTNITYPLIPSNATQSLYWSDEVTLSSSSTYLWATSRARTNSSTGYISAFSLADDGAITEQLFLTPTSSSGGTANAVTPSDFSDEWVALTDSSAGFVEVWKFDGSSASAVARVDLMDGGCCANAVWYS